MKKNFRILTVATGVLLIVTLSTTSCFLRGKKSTDDDVALLSILTGALGALSGNCLQIDKTTNQATKIDTYTVTALGVPAGGCNEATLTGTLTTSLTDAVASVTGESGVFTLMKSALTTVGECSGTTTTNINNAIAASTSTNIAAAALAKKPTGAECTNADVATGNSFAGTTYCKDDAAIAEFRNRRRFVTVKDAAAVARYDLEAKQASALTSQVGAGWTTTAIQNMRLMNSTELTVVNSNTTTAPAFKAYLVGLTAGQGACIKAIEGIHPTTLKPLFAKMVLPNSTNTVLGAFVGGLSSTGTANTKAETVTEFETITAKLACVYYVNSLDRSYTADTCAIRQPAY